MTEKEITKLFISTLKDPYYDRMVGNTTRIFANIVATGEMIESAIKSGKIQNVDARKRVTNKKKEGETNAVSYRTQLYSPYQQNQGNQSYGQTSNTVTQRNYQPNFGPVTSSPVIRPTYVATSQLANQCSNTSRPRLVQERARPDPILISYIELYPRLVENHFIAPDLSTVAETTISQVVRREFPM